MTNPTEGEKESEGSIIMNSTGWIIPEGEKEFRERFMKQFNYIEIYKDGPLEQYFQWFLAEFKALEARKEGEIEAYKEKVREWCKANIQEIGPDNYKPKDEVEIVKISVKVGKNIVLQDLLNDPLLK